MSRLTPPFSRPPAGATRAPARGVTTEWGGCNGMLGHTLPPPKSSLRVALEPQTKAVRRKPTKALTGDLD